MAKSLGIDAEGIGAKTKLYFWVNAFIREYIATLFTTLIAAIINYIWKLNLEGYLGVIIAVIIIKFKL